MLQPNHRSAPGGVSRAKAATNTKVVDAFAWCDCGNLVYGKAETPISPSLYRIANRVSKYQSAFEGCPLLICTRCRASLRAIGQEQIRQREEAYKESHPGQAWERNQRSLRMNSIAMYHLSAEMANSAGICPPEKREITKAPLIPADPKEIGLIARRMSQFTVADKTPTTIKRGERSDGPEV